MINFRVGLVLITFAEGLIVMLMRMLVWRPFVNPMIVGNTKTHHELLEQHEP
jgi:hypothetical protein